MYKGVCIACFFFFSCIFLLVLCVLVRGWIGPPLRWWIWSTNNLSVVSPSSRAKLQSKTLHCQPGQASYSFTKKNDFLLYDNPNFWQCFMYVCDLASDSLASFSHTNKTKHSLELLKFLCKFPEWLFETSSFM